MVPLKVAWGLFDRMWTPNFCHCLVAEITLKEMERDSD